MDIADIGFFDDLYYDRKHHWTRLQQANTLETVHSDVIFPESRAIWRTRVAGRGGLLGST
jgi:hypothetical protein